jgi:hypothetical protein
MGNGEDMSPHTACSGGGTNYAEGDREGKTRLVMNFRKPPALGNQGTKELLSESEAKEPRASNSTSNHHREDFGS